MSERLISLEKKGSSGGTLTEPPYNMMAFFTYVYRYDADHSAGGTSFSAYDFDNNTFICAMGNASNETKSLGDYTFDIYLSRRSFQCPYNGTIYYATKDVVPSGSSITSLPTSVSYTANTAYTIPSFSSKQMILAFVKS